MKVCSRCNKEKSFSEFVKDKRRPNGVGSYCLKCDAGPARERERKWLAANPGRSREIKRKWLAANIEKVRKYFRDKYADNPNKENQRTSSWRIANPDKRSLYQHARRARKLGNGGTVTDQEFKELCERYGNKCLRCGKTAVKLTLDHVIPLKAGGPNTIDNAQPLCKICNSIKGAKTIDYRITWETNT